jgi:hypothetical protein
MVSRCACPLNTSAAESGGDHMGIYMKAPMRMPWQHDKCEQSRPAKHVRVAGNVTAATPELRMER